MTKAKTSIRLAARLGNDALAKGLETPSQLANYQEGLRLAFRNIHAEISDPDVLTFIKHVLELELQSSEHIVVKA